MWIDRVQRIISEMANPNPPLENLRPWKPGQSGNPSGRPKTKQVRDALQKLIDELGLEPAVRAIYTKACEGDVGAFKEVADRLDGKVTQPHGGDEEAAPIATTVTIVTGVERSDDKT